MVLLQTDHRRLLSQIPGEGVHNNHETLEAATRREGRDLPVVGSRRPIRVPRVRNASRRTPQTGPLGCTANRLAYAGYPAFVGFVGFCEKDERGKPGESGRSGKAEAQEVLKAGAKVREGG